jgi:hypothetical protein
MVLPQDRVAHEACILAFRLIIPSEGRASRKELVPRLETRILQIDTRLRSIRQN